MFLSIYIFFLAVTHQLVAVLAIGECILPAYPESGRYAVLGVNTESLRPGNQVTAFTALQYTCDQNYTLSAASPNILCIGGVWTDNPTCIKRCPGLTSFTVDLVCKNGAASIPCSDDMPDGAEVDVTCKSGHKQSTFHVSKVTCRDGTWSEPISDCEAECGVVTSQGKTYVAGGYQVKKGEFPWHVGIYHNMSGQIFQICGGTIVTTNIVFSAAHCFWDNNDGGTFPAEEYLVAAGKLFREWVHPSDTQLYIQRSLVKEIHVSELYNGNVNNHEGDLAILILVTPFYFTDIVHPVCLDTIDEDLDRKQLSHLNIGKVAGWGLTEDGSPSELLKTANLPFVDFGHCKRKVAANFISSITIGKICGGYTNGTSVCEGDSGGGYVFPSSVHGEEKFYLRGVVSVGPPNLDNIGGCNSDSYTLFTRVFRHKDFIKKYVHNTIDSLLRQLTMQTSNLGCILPPLPESGNFTIVGASSKTLSPNRLVPQNTVLEYWCDPGYHISELERKVTCWQNGTWSKIPRCSKKCDPISSGTVNLECKDGLTGSLLPCNETMPSGTVVTATCKAGHHPVEARNEPSICEEGSWSSPLARCKAECGLLSWEGSYRTRGELEYANANFPWYVGVYRRNKKNSKLRQVCAGSIVTSNTIISAAHCFWDEKKYLLSGDMFAVAAGKLYKEWDDPLENEFYVQRSDVKEINAPKVYMGSREHHRDDVAVLELATPLHFTSTVHPVCLDSRAGLDNWQLRVGNSGKVAGWGLEGTSAPDGFLRIADLPYVNNSQCMEDVPPEFKAYVTRDKICGGSAYGTAICGGDEGGGYVFPAMVDSKERYYLRGVVAVGPTEEGRCAQYSYSLFTKIISHIEFIQSVTQTSFNNR